MASKVRSTVGATMSSLSIMSSDLSKAALNLPSTYANYVASNVSSVSNIESSLRSLTYLLPGARLSDQELACESIHTFIQLLSIYHDHVLKNRANLVASSPTLSQHQLRNLKTPQSKPSLHARYTMFWSNSSSIYQKVATMLKIAQYTELLWEMVARRRGGERGRWRIVVILESFKALCRLILMRITNSRPLVSPPLPLREDFAPPELAEEQNDEFAEEELRIPHHHTDPFDAKSALGEAGVPTPPVSESDKIPHRSFNEAEPYIMPRTGITLPTLPDPNTVSQYLLSHVITPDDIKPAKQLLHRLTTFQAQAAEILYVLRPVVYALLMQRIARRYGYEGNRYQKNWTPWLLGISMEYFSRQLAKRALISEKGPWAPRSGLSGLEREELKKRGMSMAWWGMRGAFYENITKNFVHGLAEKLKGKPLLDLVGGVVEDYEYLWRNYYFSTTNM